MTQSQPVRGATLEGARETIIIGAGIAGLACARRLHDAGRPFLLISEDLGGRIRRSRDGSVNIGAYYVRADYKHVNRYVRLGRRVDQLAIHRHDRDNTYTYRDRRLLFHLPQASRFLRVLLEFRRRYDRLKERTVHIGQAEAIRSDPLLLRLYHQRASAFVADQRIGDLARWYLAPGLHGTAFTSLGDINAFALLLGALPVLVPTYEFTLLFDRLAAGFIDTIAVDTVTSISSRGGRYEIETKASGSLMTERLVVATPTDVAQRLLGLSTTKRAVTANMFQVAGTLRRPYDRADIHLFPESDPTLAIARQAEGTVLVGSRQPEPDLDTYLARWQVIEHKKWSPAFHIPGDDLLDCEQGPNLYLIGDHNIVGLEDAFLTGLYAAGRVIATTESRPAAARSRFIDPRAKASSPV